MSLNSLTYINEELNAGPGTVLNQVGSPTFGVRKDNIP
jgi:hypothetical protein